MILGLDFDFPRYVAMRKGQVEQRARDGAAYSYSGERKLRRALTSTRPVTLAIEATTRLWKSRARRDLLARSEKASDRTHPRLHAAARAAGASLGLEVPAVIVPTEDFPESSATLGTEEDPIVVVSRSLMDQLDDRELVALVGHELGHVQNNHVLYATCHFYLRHEAFVFVRWIVQPAVMALSSWSRRAEVTCDRAALIAVRDLDVALAQMVKCAGAGGEVPEIRDVRAHLAELAGARRGVAAVTDLFRSYPHLVKRTRALEVFAESALYRKLTGNPEASAAGAATAGAATAGAATAGAATAGGLSADEVDQRVSEIVKVFG
jgi:Zn-dependent protease with chaperone function